MNRAVLAIAVCISLAAADRPTAFVVTPEIKSALHVITPGSLRGNLSFLASDLLAGRDTPSPGLDIAAEYIAAQFRKSGIEPAGDDGYYQNATLALQEPDPTGFQLTLTQPAKTVDIPVEQAAIRVTRAVSIDHSPIFKLDLSNPEFAQNFDAAQMNGAVVITELTRGAMQRGRSAMAKLRTAKPALLVVVERNASVATGHPSPQLVDKDETGTPSSSRISISGDGAISFYDTLKPGLADGVFAEIRVAAPKEQPVHLRNVVGILRGSDPALKDTCVLVSAHYDHIGQKSSGEGDRIYNGANDDGSGTVSVIELANALSSLKQRPKRSIVFATFFGEEKGGFGARYYARHPVLPLAQTVADINLEQVGRTDSTEGDQMRNATLTGYDYSDLARTLTAAGKLTGIKIYNNTRNSDTYFASSDNIVLAEAGVPAHSLCVAFDYSDYHGLGDEWQKINYDNMAAVDRMVAVSLLMLADSTQIPRWNQANPKAKRYFNAWKQSHSN